MKDRQIRRKQEDSHIPLISPLLHVLVMPVLVILRRDFGYLFLRPKSVFLSICWAFGLFAVYSWYEPVRWNRNPALCWFGLIAVLFYLFHFIRTVASQFGKSQHDQYTGTSWLSVLNGEAKVISLWIEPGFAIFIAMSLRFHLGENPLSKYLTLAAVALWTKEAINQWFHKRKVKRQVDALEDTEEVMGKVMESRPDATPAIPTNTKTTRKKQVNRKRSATQQDAEIEKHAAILRMIPPYTFEQANENYRKLAKQIHPDASEETDDTSEAMTNLSEAREFFRRFDEKKYSGH